MLGFKTRAQLRAQFEPQADYGFFGPDSVTWQVWSYPTSYILGFTRSVTIEHFDPHLAAAVVQSGGVTYRPSTRYGRTLRYFGMVAFGATEPTARASAATARPAVAELRTIHTIASARKPSRSPTIRARALVSSVCERVTVVTRRPDRSAAGSRSAAGRRCWTR